MTQKIKIRLLFLFIIVLAIVSAFIASPKTLSFKVYKWNVKFPPEKVSAYLKEKNIGYHLGLDLQGGTHLVYEAELNNLSSTKAAEAMEGVRDVIERRVNIFGVAEPLIQIEGKNRLVIDLAGVKEISQAIKMIGETPSLEFREETPRDQVAAEYKKQTGQDLPAEAVGPFFLASSDLTGKDLVRGQADYDQSTGALRQPIVKLEFNEEGKKKFAALTTRNVGKVIAIYLDGVSITAPRVNEAITDGSAIISGNFTIEEAKTLAKRLNAGALPVPIKLISQQTVGATLGQDSLAKSLKAGSFGFLLIALFMILYYRLPGLIASISLVIYTLIVVAIFNFLSITLTLAGIAGLILSIGMAVDANVLIFERMREELTGGRSFKLAVEDGFSRAWPSIRDSNLTTLITAMALFWFGSGSIKGFAIALSIGILISMFSAITITRNFLLLILSPKLEKYKQLF
ncbi:MAG: protein translocase subunit SecD [bacterium]|nr:protein translocase subunit SecD [bacterium]